MAFFEHKGILFYVNNLVSKNERILTAVFQVNQAFSKMYMYSQVHTFQLISNYCVMMYHVMLAHIKCKNSAMMKEIPLSTCFDFPFAKLMTITAESITAANRRFFISCYH